jgi:hypothetical protein
MPNRLYVCQVLQTTGSELVCDEACSGDIARGKVAIDQELFALLVDGGEVDASNLLKDIKTVRGLAESRADRWR